MKWKKGYTLVEVALFLALTGALFAGIIVGTQNSIWQQRYSDAVQSYANFLRNIYSEVANPEGIGDGRSELAIYGKLVSFGQTIGLNGERLEPWDQRIYVYDVVGKATSTGTGSVKEMLKKLDANVVVEEDNGDGTIKVVPAGIVESYKPAWSSSVETKERDATNGKNLFKGSILVVRHPRSGTISTLVALPSENFDGVIEVNQMISFANVARDYSEIETLLTEVLGKFEMIEVDFCVNPNGFGQAATARRDIRLVENARNSSGVEIIESDGINNRCISK